MVDTTCNRYHTLPTSYAEARALHEEHKAKTGYRIVQLTHESRLYSIAGNKGYGIRYHEYPVVQFRPDGVIDVTFHYMYGSKRIALISAALPEGWEINTKREYFTELRGAVQITYLGQVVACAGNKFTLDTVNNVLASID